MLRVEWAGAAQLLHSPALFHVVYDRDGLGFGAVGNARSIAEGGGRCHLGPGRGVKTWSLFPCRKLGVSMAIA